MNDNDAKQCDDGKVLARFPRGQRDRGAPPNEELWICLREYEGRQYIDLRIRFRGERGDWLPTKKGVTIRLKEIEAVQTALAEVVQLTSEVEQ